MFDIGFASLETEDSVLIVFSKSNVRSSDFQVDKGRYFEVGKGISNFSKSQKPRPGNLKCGVDVELVFGDRNCSCSTLEYLFCYWKSIFFHLWKKASSALKNSGKSGVPSGTDIY